MSVIISIGKLVDDIPDQEVIRVIYRGKDYGFQETPHSQALLLKVLEDAISIEDMSSESINSKNANTVISRVTQSKYGVIAHQCSDTLNASIKLLPAYRFRMQRNMAYDFGTDADASKKIIENVFSSKSHGETIRALLPLCSFVTIWPKYWGEYGEHFFVVSEDLERAEAHIRNVLDNELVG
ncbi:hypothetical protein [Pseudomonas indica]|uniref:hypothetical protein n=1 Tax=Pseudomonas indica TaxID=137658 RepID=UPI0023F99A3A|nr:hypothetical protein [Pseudomonas indica]MBU3058734.1 hypothetical protein [Pseudomonas indica]